MRNVILYIAMSLDGYIADDKGNVDWLGGDESEQNNHGSFPDFFESVDTVIMGYRTYHQVVTQLSPDIWPYAGKQSYILTHHKLESSDEIRFISQDLTILINKLKNQSGKNIWICGGASIVNQLLEHDLIDRFCISMIPTILGNGIRLFSTMEKEMRLNFISSQCYNGITDLVYERRDNN